MLRCAVVCCVCVYSICVLLRGVKGGCAALPALLRCARYVYNTTKAFNVTTHFTLSMYFVGLAALVWIRFATAYST
jgi:hypothetical protein